MASPRPARGQISREDTPGPAVTVPTTLTALNSYASASLPAATAGSLARVTDSTRGIWTANGSVWYDLDGVVNVMDFGATGDGATDDTAALLAAIAATPAGYTLDIPGGNYLFSQMLVIDKCIRIRGSMGGINSSAVHWSPTLTFTGAGTGDPTTAVAGIRITTAAATNAELVGFQLDNVGTADIGIDIWGPINGNKLKLIGIVAPTVPFQLAGVRIGYARGLINVGVTFPTLEDVIVRQAAPIGIDLHDIDAVANFIRVRSLYNSHLNLNLGTATETVRGLHTVNCTFEQSDKLDSVFVKRVRLWVSDGDYFESGGTCALGNIAGASDNGAGLIRIETTAAHGLTTGQRVNIFGIVGTTEANAKGWFATNIDATHFDLTTNRVNVSNAEDNGGGLIRITTETVHGLNTGDTVTIADVVGTVEANGAWTVTKISTTIIDLQASAFVNPYVSGGTASRPSIFSNAWVSGGKWVSPWSGNVTNIADNGAGLIRVTTDASHGLTTGAKLHISNVGGTCSYANGTYFVTVVDPTHFDLDDSTYDGTKPYTWGGNWQQAGFSVAIADSSIGQAVAINNPWLSPSATYPDAFLYSGYLAGNLSLHGGWSMALASGGSVIKNTARQKVTASGHQYVLVGSATSEFDIKTVDNDTKVTRFSNTVSGVSEPDYDYDKCILRRAESSTGRMIPVAGDGITVLNAGQLTRQVFAVELTYEAFSANALTADTNVCIIPARSRVVGVFAQVTEVFTGGAVSAASLTIGKTAGGTQYLAASDVFTTVRFFGDAEAEVGTALARGADVQGGDMPGYTSNITVQARLTTVTANTDQLTQGKVKIWFVTEYLADGSETVA